MIFFNWGRKSVPLGPESIDCEACGVDGQQQLYFLYHYIGLFWLGTAFNRKLAAECISCSTGYEFTGSPAAATKRLVSWNYRYGWMIWSALLALAFVFG